MENTSLAAITLPNGNRHVYFQETSGAFRRALYSFQANEWQADPNATPAGDAKNNTPLVAIGSNDPNVSTHPGLYLDWIDPYVGTHSLLRQFR